MKGAVRLSELCVSHGARRVVHSVSLDIAPGEFVCLLGPSGCGKTTTLRAVAGLNYAESGTIAIDGVVANELPAHRRNIAMVFQDLALFPHMTVEENIGFGLVLRKVGAAESSERIAQMLSLLRLQGFEERLPRELSGGQQQRVAIARSLVVRPTVLLLDEPFAALDRKLREEMRREIRALQRRLALTVVFVTHDQEEALTMADRVVVMNHGRIEQEGPPDVIYERPASRFVLDFVGQTNFLAVTRADGSLRLAGATLRAAGARLAGEGPQVAIRPERIHLDGPGENRVAGRVEDVSYEGAVVTYEVVLPDGQRVLLRAANLGEAERRRIGEGVTLTWRAADTLVIGEE
ncbi:MAG: ABC transporter ATP-binding protein [Parvibaculaceae bacterium]